MAFDELSEMAQYRFTITTTIGSTLLRKCIYSQSMYPIKEGTLFVVRIVDYRIAPRLCLVYLMPEVLFLQCVAVNGSGLTYPGSTD